MESIWSRTCEIRRRESLQGDIETDAVVIGGGMAGILTAYQLERAGIHTAVLEAERIGGGQTKNTTAKITSQHGMFCKTFIEKKGKETATKYVQANQDSVEEYKRIIKEEKIDCDFEEQDSYVYSQDAEKLKQEAEVACDLGISASYVKEIEVPVSCAGAVKYARQGQFHPLKFMAAIAERLTVYENSPVKEIEEHIVRTIPFITSSSTITDLVNLSPPCTILCPIADISSKSLITPCSLCVNCSITIFIASS